MPWHERWRNVFRTERLSAQLDDELAFHIAETVDRLVADGMPEEGAWREARRRLGNYSIQKERTRDMDVAGWLEAAWADFLYGLRQLRLNPGFATVAILSLALGIGQHGDFSAAGCDPVAGIAGEGSAATGDDRARRQARRFLYRWVLFIKRKSVFIRANG